MVTKWATMSKLARLGLSVMTLELLGLAGCATTELSNAPGAASDPIGTVYRDSFRLGGRHLPLPAGEWTLTIRNKRQSTRGSEASPVVEVYLTQLDAGKIRRSVVAMTNLESNRVGWLREGSLGTCDRHDVHFSYFDRNYNIRDTECWIVNHIVVTRGQNAGKFYDDIYDWSADKGRSAATLVSMFYVAKGGDFVWALYSTNPELDGFERSETAWRAHPWHRDYAVSDPKKVAYIAKIKAEGERLFEQIKAGFSRPLPASR